MAAFAQEKTFTLQGKIVNEQGKPVADVYVINPRTFEKDITLSNGVFTAKVLPSDSLIFSHISYFRKSLRVQQMQHNPEVILEAENIQIPDIVVSPNKMNDMERAKKNLSFLNDYKAIHYKRMAPDTDPLTTMMTEHNSYMRTEAASINLLPIAALPIQLIDKAIQKRKHRKQFSSYSSTRKQKVLLEEEQ